MPNEYLNPKTVIELITLAGIFVGFCAATWRYAGRAWRRTWAVWRAGEDAIRKRELYGETPVDAQFEALSSNARAVEILGMCQEVVLEQLKIAYYVCDAQSGGCIFASSFLGELFGMSPQQMLGDRWLAAITDSDSVAEQWANAVSRNSIYEATYTVTNQRDGRRYRCKTKAVLLRIVALFMWGGS